MMIGNNIICVFYKTQLNVNNFNYQINITKALIKLIKIFLYNEHSLIGMFDVQCTMSDGLCYCIYILYCVQIVSWFLYIICNFSFLKRKPLLFSSITYPN